MKKLDAICNKLRQGQRSDSPQPPLKIVEEEEEDDASDDDYDERKVSGSTPSDGGVFDIMALIGGNKNKRKNFTPKICMDKINKMQQALGTTAIQNVSQQENEEKQKIFIEQQLAQLNSRQKSQKKKASISSDDSDDDDVDLQGHKNGATSGRVPSWLRTSAGDRCQLPLASTTFNGNNTSEASDSRMSDVSTPDDDTSRHDMSGQSSPSINGVSTGANSSTGGSTSAAALAQQMNSALESYISRFWGTECGSEQCKYLSAREHFHCKLCNYKLFTKKEEMLRHYKWHRKREESLAHGFLRYSASDDCSIRFGGCVHNMRQTHYHCLQEGCEKVYISTSDVQMHANSHRKAAHIAKEGFQRFKCTEHCGFDDCPFMEPANRTTHFHCLRPGCSHSFKNKADMDKHKAHHLRDEHLNKDGFKKFMKCETCTFNGCAFSRIVNHIHCIRSGCDYVLHSTSQMYSHKRKHEKQDKRVKELCALQEQQQKSTQLNDISAQIKQLLASKISSVSSNAQQDVKPTVRSSTAAKRALEISKKVSTSPDAGNLKMKLRKSESSNNNDNGETSNYRFVPHGVNSSSNIVKFEDNNDDVESDADVDGGKIDMNTLQQPISLLQQMASLADADLLMPDSGQASPNNVADASGGAQSGNNALSGFRTNKGDENWKKFITRYTANDRCIPLCPLMYKDHYHCTAGEGCVATFRSKDGVRDHAKQHEFLSMAVTFYKSYEKSDDCGLNTCPFLFKERHYHCNWPSCSEVIGSSEPVFRRLEHHKVHEYSSSLLNLVKNQLSATRASSTLHSDLLTAANLNAAQLLYNEVRRKRGRPPKYNVLDVNVNPSSPTVVRSSPDILLTSFKLSKPYHQPSRRGRPRTVSSPRHPEPADVGHYEPQHNPFESKISPVTGRPQFGGFTTYLPNEPCPDAQCRHVMQLHFHCRQPRCFYNTNLPEPLESHAQDFHQAFEIPDGYACYDRSYNCRLSFCVHNGNVRHFHCLTAGCGGSLKYNELAAHTTQGHSHISLGNNDVKPMKRQSPVTHSNDSAAGRTVKTSGIFYPASQQFLNENNTNTTGGANANVAQCRSNVNAPTVHSKKRSNVNANFESNETSSKPPASSSLFNASVSVAPFLAGQNSLAGGTVSPNMSLAFSIAQQQQTSSLPLPYTVEQQCGRPFCKLKRRLHYHCSHCYQGFSHFDRLASHLQKHGIAPPIGPPPPLVLSPATASQSVSSVTAATTTMTSSSKGSQSGGVIQPPPVPHVFKIEKSDKAPATATAESPDGAGGMSIGRVGPRKMKFHMFQPEMMKFTLDGRPVLMNSDAAIEVHSMLPTLPTKDGSSRKSAATTVARQQPPPPAVNGANGNVSKSRKHKQPASTTSSPAHHDVGAKRFKFVDCSDDMNETAGSASVGASVRSAKSASANHVTSEKDLVPEGFIKMKDCSYTSCLYSGLQMHFHCTKSMCNYSCITLEHCISHTVVDHHHNNNNNNNNNNSTPQAASDLSGTKSSEPTKICSNNACELRDRMAVHYHCSKCQFWTSEPTRLAVHTKQHSRLDQVASLGFHKVCPSPDCLCPYDDCPFTAQSHYHCLNCNFIALNQIQMQNHKQTSHGVDSSVAATAVVNNFFNNQKSSC